MQKLSFMMHGKKTVVVLIILFALVCSVSAAGTGNQVTDEILIQDCNTRPEYAPPITDTVSQGETNRHTYTPVSGQVLEVSLTWNRDSSGNDLDLCIVPPNSNHVWIQDDVDGKLDGKISVRTVLVTEDLNRIWIVEISGAQVSGTQPYTLIINSY